MAAVDAGIVAFHCFVGIVGDAGIVGSGRCGHCCVPSVWRHLIAFFQQQLWLEAPAPLNISMSGTSQNNATLISFPQAEMRSIDREVRKIQLEENKIKVEIKALAKKKEMNAVKTLAKSVLLYTEWHEMNALSVLLYAERTAVH